MLYYLHFLHRTFEGFNVFHYITFRIVGATLTALVLCWLFGPWLIEILRRLKMGQPLRQKDEVHKLAELHSGKKGTPTMGGVLILLAVTVSCLLWVRLEEAKLVWITLGAMLFLGAIGFLDDYIKVSKKKSAGLPGRLKLVAQVATGLAVGGILLADPVYRHGAESLAVPFLRTTSVDLGWWALLFFVLVITGASNAVNLTDGLDGLAGGCTITVAFVYAVFAYVVGNAKIASYLFIPHVPHAGELAIFCGALLGATLGFLWYNCHPARVFMGDTGSLAIGGALGVVAICIGQELLLVLAGGIFVIEALSVIIQVFSFKMTGKRVFAMAPIHHHFELKGWAESQVTIRFWIMSLLCALMALATLKLR
ncbi:Phospho-N-acetylmuramoyl-pentapeptide-transferase [Verrucomicrobium sp. GAS474]|uniref:phospho-N-acetylmuramoyl-pentapeptide- transferase n=1 Tax=Verrucomicrobium sp. GAS474 TaxID=1882831 RepID=UPI00087D78E9|nr:phospho-N-acetylmuramoyl-pentapeptide-transferase [Verrucomicrobium sp. GAS474]SDU28823.1 Phospho-N-acetylmuramoyl-pentapeptide-transferase [Verrucomicrobium sp. GAS474]